MANLREALVDLEKFLGMNIDCDSLLLFYGACQKVGVDLNKFMEKLAGNPGLIKNFSSILETVGTVVAVATNIFRINRSTPFEPVSLLGSGASFWRGPKDGKGLEGEIEQDARSMALSEIDLGKIRFKSYIPEGQSLVSGENRIVAIGNEHDIALDPKIGQDLYEEEGQKALHFLHDTTGVTWMEFLGQPLRDSDGYRYSLVLYRDHDGSWLRSYGCLDNDRDASYPAAVLSSN